MHNGKLKLSDYIDLPSLSDLEAEKIRRAIAKRQRREEREHHQAKTKKKKGSKA